MTHDGDALVDAEDRLESLGEETVVVSYEHANRCHDFLALLPTPPGSCLVTLAL